MATKKHTCPRRRENGMDVENALRGSGPNLDTYEPKHGLVGQPTGCSYCGSMDPEDFMNAVRTGAEIGPTDKSYKLYVKGLPTDPDELWCAGKASHPQPGYRPYSELTKAEKAAVRKDWVYDVEEGYYGLFHMKDSVEGKFYTQHLSEEQGWEFDRLWKEHKIVWGMPGAPYVPLFIPGPSTTAKS